MKQKCYANTTHIFNIFFYSTLVPVPLMQESLGRRRSPESLGEFFVIVLGLRVDLFNLSFCSKGKLFNFYHFRQNFLGIRHNTHPMKVKCNN